METMKCKQCGAQIAYEGSALDAKCPACGNHQPVPRKVSTGDPLDRCRQALNAKDWPAARSAAQEALSQQEKDGQANVYMLLASEECSSWQAFLRKRKAAHGYPPQRLLNWKGNAEHIKVMQDRFCIPGYVTQEEIRKLYSCQESYQSRLSSCQLNYSAEEMFWENQMYLARALKYAQGALAAELQAGKQEIFSHLQEQIRSARQEDAAQISALEQKYAQQIEEADQKAEALYNQALEQREKDYAAWVAVMEGNPTPRQLAEAAQFFSALGGYEASAALAEKCKKQLGGKAAAKPQQKPSARKKKTAAYRKRVLILSAVAAVLVLIIAAMLVMSGPTASYAAAERMLSEGRYLEAMDAFAQLGDYRDSSRSAQYAQACYFLTSSSDFSADTEAALHAMGINTNIQSGETMSSEVAVSDLITRRLSEWNLPTMEEKVSKILSSGMTSDYQIANMAYMNGNLLFDGQIYDPFSGEGTRRSVRISSYSAEEMRIFTCLDNAQRIFSFLGDFRGSEDMYRECIYQRALTMTEFGVVNIEKNNQAHELLLSISDYPAAAALLERFQYQQVRKTVYEEGGDPENPVVTHYAYDRYGQLWGEREYGTACVYYTYNDAGQIATREKITDGRNGQYQMDFYWYNAAGDLQSHRTVYDRGENPDYSGEYENQIAYNHDGTVQSITYWTGESVKYTYDEQGRRKTAESFSSSGKPELTETYYYNDQGLVTEKTVKDIVNLSIPQKDNKGKITGYKDSFTTKNDRYLYEYDENGLLIRERFIRDTNYVDKGYEAEYTYGWIYAPGDTMECPTLPDISQNEDGDLPDVENLPESGTEPEPTGEETIPQETAEETTGIHPGVKPTQPGDQPGEATQPTGSVTPTGATTPPESTAPPATTQPPAATQPPATTQPPTATECPPLPEVDQGEDVLPEVRPNLPPPPPPSSGDSGSGSGDSGSAGGSSGDSGSSSGGSGSSQPITNEVPKDIPDQGVTLE